jgi:hypothetical protein
VARTFGTHFVITANLTDDGAPVYLREDGHWSPRLQEALATTDEAHRDALLQDAATQERRVCDPYAFKVNLERGVATASTARERIRSAGPTTPLRRPDVRARQTA